MKILKHLFLLTYLGCCSSECINAQEVSALTLYDELNPDFKLEKIHLPNKKNANIIGQAPDGRLLVRCTKDADPPTSRADPDYFWVGIGSDGGSRIVEEEKDSLPGFLQEIAALNKNTLYWTKKIQEQDFFQKVADEAGGSVPRSPCFDEYEILNPCIFHPRTSNYPLLLFSAKSKGRKTSFDIYYSELKGSKWTCPKQLSAKGINTDENDEKYPFVAQDGTLFFSSDRIEGTGEKGKAKNFNLWAAVPTHRPYWENASVNPLPPPFNTRGEERVIAPMGAGLSSGFLVSDSAQGSLKLYFFKNTTEYVPPPPQRYYALVIGAKDYDNDYWEDLKCPIEESRQLAQILEKDYGFQVTSLESPDSSDFMEALGQYQRLEENEYLLVAYIGHGMRHIHSKDNSIYISQLACRDADKCGGWTGDLTTCQKPIARGINPDAFSKMLSLQSKHILVILDACRSGYFLPTETMPGCEDKSRWVISSTLGKEVGDCNHFFSGLRNTLSEGPPPNDLEMDGYELSEKVKRFMVINKEHSKLKGEKEDVNEPQYQHFPRCNKGLHFPFPPKRN